MGMPTPTPQMLKFLALGYEGEDESLMSGGSWEAQVYGDENQDYGYDDTEVAGWTITRSWSEATMKKDDKTVKFLNISQYESVGEVECCYYSNDRQHLEDFLKDVGATLSIKKDQIVNVWS